MISACWFDFIVSRKALLQQMIVALVVALVMAFSTGTSMVIVPVMVCAVVIALPVTLSSLDERGGWERLRASFPLSRGQIMAGRSLYLALATLATIVLGLLLAIAFSLAAPLIPAFFAEDALAFACDPFDLLLVSLCSVGIVGVITGIMLPLLARFGITRTLTVLPLAFVAIFVAVSLILGSTEFAAMVGPLMGTGSEEMVLMAILLFACAGVVVFALCSFLAARVYENRQL